MKILLVLLSVLSFSATAASVNGFEATYWGFLKASSMYASEGLASYNNVNLSAPTHAVGHLATRPADKTSRMSTQVQQSRIGFGLKKGENLSAKFEFDFIDFNKSSPTTQMVPRVRIASLTYNLDAHNKVIIGQDWDLFSPVTSYTFDYVGLYFMAGNTGFMRQQVQFIHDNDEWEFGGAVGMAGNNPGTQDQDLELSKSPTFSARASKKLTKGRVGVSGIYSHLKYDRDLGAAVNARSWSTDSYGANGYYEQQYEGGLEVKSEIYYGQNMNNIGTLAIGKGNATTNVKEFGGTLTANKKVSDRGYVFGGVGMAKADQRSKVPVLAFNATNAITAPGVTRNFLSRVGYNFLVTEDLSWVTEVSRYETQSRVAANHFQNNLAYSLESGIQLRF